MNAFFVVVDVVVMRGSRVFFRGGPSFFYNFSPFYVFFSWLGERGSNYHYKRAITGPPAKCYCNDVSPAGRWWPNTECWLVSFVVLQGIRTSITKKPYILWFFFFFGGGVVRTPCPPSRSAHGCCCIAGYISVLLLLLLTQTYRRFLWETVLYGSNIYLSGLKWFNMPNALYWAGVQTAWISPGSGYFNFRTQGWDFRCFYPYEIILSRIPHSNVLTIFHHSWCQSEIIGAEFLSHPYTHDGFLKSKLSIISHRGRQYTNIFTQLKSIYTCFIHYSMIYRRLRMIKRTNQKHAS